MGWRFPGEAFKNVVSEGSENQLGVEALVAMLNQAIGKTEEEAKDWTTMLGQFEQNAALANNQEDLDELMDILGDVDEQAEVYSDVLNDPTYKMSAWRANQIYNQRRPQVLGFENTLTQLGVDKLNTNTDFDTYYYANFFDEVDGKNVEKKGKEWDEAYLKWEQDRGGAPITFDSDYADYNTFWNHWIKMSQSNVSEDIKRTNSPINLIKTNYNKYSNIINDLTAMGVQFERTSQGWLTGAITNLPALSASGFKTSFEIPYIDENGNEQTQTMTLSELARTAVEQQSMWANFSDGYSNQTIEIGGTRLVPDKDGNMVVENIQPSKYNVFSQDEMMNILTMEQNEFKAYVASRQEKLPEKIKTHQSRQSGYLGILADLTVKINTMREAQRENQGMVQFANQLQLNEDQKELLAGIDLTNLDQQSIQQMQGLYDNVQALYLREISDLEQTTIDAISYGAYNVENLPPALENVLNQNAPDAEKGPIVYENLQELEESAKNQMANYTSLSELKSLFGKDYNDFIRFYLGELQGQDILPITKGELTIYDGTQLIPSPIITEFSEYNSNNPNESINKMHPDYNLDQLYLKNDYINSVVELFNYSNVQQELIDVSNKFNIAGEEILYPRGNESREATVSRLKSINSKGKLEDGTILPKIAVAANIPEGLTVTDINTGLEIKIDLNANTRYKILSMSNNFNQIGEISPTRNIEGEIETNYDDSFLGRRNLDGQTLISDKMRTGGYQSNFNPNFGENNYPLMWHYESSKPNIFVIGDERGNIYLVDSSEFIKDGKNVFITDPSLNSVITVGKMPFDIVNWKLHNKNFNLKDVGKWENEMFNFPHKIN